MNPELSKQDNGANQATVVQLMQAAIDAGRLALQAAQKDPRTDPEDLHNAESQFAFTLIIAGDCPEAATFLDSHIGVRAGGIQRLILSPQADRSCKTILARRMLERSRDDPHYIPAGWLANRFEAATYLDAAGDPAAPAIMHAAEAEMQKLPGTSTLWEVRRRAIGSYPLGPARSRYLEYLAQRILIEQYGSTDLEWRNLLIAFAYDGRCDLIQKVTRHGPESCREPQTDANRFGQPAANEANMQKFADYLNAPARVMDSIPLDNRAITAALAAPDLWWRMTRLLALVERCKRQLKPAP